MIGMSETPPTKAGWATLERKDGGPTRRYDGAGVSSRNDSAPGYTNFSLAIRCKPCMLIRDRWLADGLAKHTDYSFDLRC